MMRCGTDHGGVIRNSANLVISAPERTRESILTTLRVNMSWLASPPIRAHLANPNVSLNVVRTGTLRGAPVSLYGVVPMDKLESHAPLLRLWTLAMFSELLKREHVPEQSTLFLAEEAATLGALPALKTAFCQLRGNGVSPALIYQDPAQVRAIWGDSWTLFRNNADVVSVFGARHPAAARDYGDFVGWSGDLSHMDQTTQVVSIRGEGLRQLRRLSVVQDGWLAKRMYSPDYDKGASVHAG
jgi:type IV secretion system protein VirD4